MRRIRDAPANIAFKKITGAGEQNPAQFPVTPIFQLPLILVG
jgi:hypothetical protein